MEVMSLEVPVESVGTVTAVHSWKQRVPDFMRCTDYAQDSFRRLVLESLDKHTGRFYT